MDADAAVCDQITGRVSEHLAKLAQRKELPVGIRYDVGIAMSDEAPETVDGLLRKADEEIQKKKARKTQTTP